jgi:hypothetical protein
VTKKCASHVFSIPRPQKCGSWAKVSSVNLSRPLLGRTQNLELVAAGRVTRCGNNHGFAITAPCIVQEFPISRFQKKVPENYRKEK